MFKIRQGDTVQVIKGKDKDKKGKVLKILPHQNKALVEGINLIKKHRRKTTQEQQGGIVSLEAPISLANLMLLCKNCNKPTRVGVRVLPDATKARFCKACKELI